MSSDAGNPQGGLPGAQGPKGPSHHQVGGKRGPGLWGVNTQEPLRVQTNLAGPQPSGTWQGPSQPQSGNGAASLPPSGSRLQGLSLVWGVHVRAWRPIWTRTALGWMQDVLDWLHGGIREPGLQPPPRPRLAPEAWHAPDLTNPRKSGQLFPNTTLGRPRTWLSSAG